jgi:DNA-directed RNA polymerases I, II, and III subunit RPABC2
MPKKAKDPAEDEEYEEDVVEDEEEEETEVEEEEEEEEIDDDEESVGEEVSLESVSDDDDEVKIRRSEEEEEEDASNPSYLLVHKDEEDEDGLTGEDAIVITDTNITEDAVDTDVAQPQTSVPRFYHKKGTKLGEEDMMTKQFLNKYEKTRLLATRARQIALGSPPMVPFPREGQPDPMELAVRELKEKVTPLIIRRTLPSGAYEEFRVKDLDDIYLD